MEPDQHQALGSLTQELHLGKDQPGPPPFLPSGTPVEGCSHAAPFWVLCHGETAWPSGASRGCCLRPVLGCLAHTRGTQDGRQCPAAVLPCAVPLQDFGDYQDGYYSVQTTEGEQIAQLIAGYIDIILKKVRLCQGGL